MKQPYVKTIDRLFEDVTTSGDLYPRMRRRDVDRVTVQYENFSISFEYEPCDDEQDYIIQSGNLLAIHQLLIDK